MFRLVAINILIATAHLVAAPVLIGAPTPDAPVANQLVVSGNACGPTALLNAFRLGNPSWQRASNMIKAESDKQCIYTIIREFGMRPSKTLKGHPRWSKKGVNLSDLCDIGNEMIIGQFLPPLSSEVMFRDAKETPEKLLYRAHTRFKTSLEKGLPPIVSLRRYVKRGREWIAIDAHFVTVTTIPRKLEKGANSFAISYVDPWGGKLCQGTIAIADRGILADSGPASPCLEAAFPQASVGKKSVRSGEMTALTLAAVIGRW